MLSPDCSSVSTESFSKKHPGLGPSPRVSDLIGLWCVCGGGGGAGNGSGGLGES